MNERRQIRFGIVGYGEVGRALALGLRQEGLEPIFVYQRSVDASVHEAIEASRVRLVSSPVELAERADFIFSATPGSQSLAAASAIAPALRAHHCYVDLASATPEIKQRIGKLLASSGALVGDGAIEGSPLVDGHRVHITISGPAAAACGEALVPWGLRIAVFGANLGDAAAIRLLRTIVQKGLAAVLIECIVAAGYYGVRDELLRSIARYYDDRPFIEIADRMLRTTAVHARRRAEETEMVAATLSGLGFEPRMTSAAADLLTRIADLELKEKLGGVVPERYEDAVDMMERAVRKVECGGVS